MDVQNWQDPETRASAGAARAVAEALRSRQGEFAVIEEYEVPVVPEGASPEEKAAVETKARKVRAKASSRASLIKQGRVAAFRSTEKGWPGTFEAVSRTVEDTETGKKVIRVFAKYRGEEFAEEPKAKAPKSAPVSDGSGPAPTSSALTESQTEADFVESSAVEPVDAN